MNVLFDLNAIFQMSRYRKFGGYLGKKHKGVNEAIDNAITYSIPFETSDIVHN